MNFKKKICIVGTGGFGKETLCCLIDMNCFPPDKASDFVSFMVDDEFYNEKEVLGINVIRKSEFNSGLYDVIVAVGDPALRRKIVEGLPKETTYATLVHPSAVISKWVKIGQGSIITAGTVLTCNIQIGDHAHLNLNTTIGHDCKIGDYFTTAPAVNVSGNCTIGTGVYLGTNASVREKTVICSNVLVGMGSVVLKNITEGGVYVGNPLRKL